MNRAARFAGWVVFSMACIVARPVGADDRVETDAASISAAWRMRSKESARVRMEWRRAAARGADRFARAGAEWIPADGGGDDQTAVELLVDDDRLLYSGWRTAVRVHGYDPEQMKAITATVGAASPERMGAPFLRALLGHFDDENAERRPAQRFRRSYDGGVLQDYWEGGTEGYPRATLHAMPARGSPEWATLQHETALDERLQTLELMAAVLGMRPDHPLLGIEAGRLSVLPEEAVIGGAKCVMVQEASASDPGVSRRLFVDCERERLVRRYIGTAGGEGVQIDLEYARDVSGRSTPAGWTVMRFGNSDRPVQDYARSEVAKVGQGTALDDSRLQFVHPAGTWVVDRQSGESYLVEAEGGRRNVTEAELRWLPTYEELLQTRSGEAGVFIEERNARAEQWRTVRWPLVAGGALLLTALVVKWCGRRRMRGGAAAFARSGGEADERKGIETPLRS